MVRFYTFLETYWQTLLGLSTLLLVAGLTLPTSWLTFTLLVLCLPAPTLLVIFMATRGMLQNLRGIPMQAHDWAFLVGAATLYALSVATVLYQISALHAPQFLIYVVALFTLPLLQGLGAFSTDMRHAFIDAGMWRQPQ